MDSVNKHLQVFKPVRNDAGTFENEYENDDK